MYLDHVDENNKRIRVWRGDPEPLVRVAIDKKFYAKYPLLNGIELYQDTYFNTRQTERLIEELRRFADELEPKAKKSIDDLIGFLQENELHHYFRFVGD